MTRNCPSRESNARIPASLFTMQTELAPGLTIHSCINAGHTGSCLSIVDLMDLGTFLDDKQTGRSALDLLSPKEREILAGFSYTKRRNEWAGGRLCGKTCISILGGDSFQPGLLATLSILPSPNGSPVLSCSSRPRRSRPALSISHSRRYGVAMAAMTKSCGVDIQKISSQTIRVADRFSDPAEQGLLLDTLPEMDESTRLTLLWAAKEALKKSLLADQPMIFKGVSLQSIKSGDHLSLKLSYAGKQPVQAYVNCVTMGDYILAFTSSNMRHA